MPGGAGYLPSTVVSSVFANVYPKQKIREMIQFDSYDSKLAQKTPNAQRLLKVFIQGRPSPSL